MSEIRARVTVAILQASKNWNWENGLGVYHVRPVLCYDNSYMLVYCNKD